MTLHVVGNFAKSLKVICNYATKQGVCKFLLAFHCNCVSLSCIISDIKREKTRFFLPRDVYLPTVGKITWCHAPAADLWTKLQPDSGMGTEDRWSESDHYWHANPTQRVASSVATLSPSVLRDGAQDCTAGHGRARIERNSLWLDPKQRNEDNDDRHWTLARGRRNCIGRRRPMTTINAQSKMLRSLFYYVVSLDDRVAIATGDRYRTLSLPHFPCPNAMFSLVTKVTTA